MREPEVAPLVAAFWPRRGSAGPEFLLCGAKTGFSRNFGHVDVLASAAAHREVWPRIIAWLTSAVATAS